MSSFQAPTNPEGLPSILPSTRGLQRKLFRHYRARPEGINVYIFSDNTVSENDPDGSTSFWRIEQGSPYVTHAFWGGHDADPITDAESTLLTTAGYTVIP